MVDLSDGMVAQLAQVAARLVPVLGAQIPAGPAARLGRLGALGDWAGPAEQAAARSAARLRLAAEHGPGVAMIRERALGRIAADNAPGGIAVGRALGRISAGRMGAASPTARAAGEPSTCRTAPGEPPARAALRSLETPLIERLLGALELTVADLDLTGVPDLSTVLAPRSEGRFAVVEVGGTSEAVTATSLLEQACPGVTDLIVDLAGRLAAHPMIAGLLTGDTEPAGAAPARDAAARDVAAREVPAPDASAAEQAITAAHGRAHLALAVASASMVVSGIGSPPVVDRTPAAIGAGIGAAVLLLHQVPMPPGYAAAVLAKVRAEYLLPRQTSGSVPVSGHRFALAEDGIGGDADLTGNGLVAVVEGGVVIRTGVAEGRARVTVTVLAEAPSTVESGWDEVVEVSWRADTGLASVVGPSGPGDSNLRQVTPPWPGHYRLRVHARGRDDAAESTAERYSLVVWQAPEALEIVHRRTDRLGHRLRGEPEPARPDRPELAYAWIRRGSIGVAATVTMVTGATTEQVLVAFGADAAEPVAARDIVDDLLARRSIDPWVMVLDLGDAVLAVEDNGVQGSHGPVLRRASAHGRAASVFWNVNGVTRLSFAEGGQLLASFEPLGDVDVDVAPAVAEALAGLEFTGDRDTVGMQLVAVQRFTGRGMTAADLQRMTAAGIGFRVVPQLPELHRYRQIPAVDWLGPVAGTLIALSEPQLRDVAWWAAAEAARHAGFAADEDVTASVDARALTEAAQWRARRSQLDGGEHRWLWLTLHRATNPDPRSAVIGVLDAARYAAGAHAAAFIDSVRARLTAL